MSKVTIAMERVDAVKLRTILSVKLEGALEAKTAFHEEGLPIPSWMTDDINQFRSMLEIVEAAIDNAE